MKRNLLAVFAFIALTLGILSPAIVFADIPSNYVTGTLGAANATIGVNCPSGQSTAVVEVKAGLSGTTVSIFTATVNNSGSPGPSASPAWVNAAGVPAVYAQTISNSGKLYVTLASDRIVYAKVTTFGSGSAVGSITCTAAVAQVSLAGAITPAPAATPTSANSNCSFSGSVLTCTTPTPLPSPTASSTGCGLLSWSGLTIHGDTTACATPGAAPTSANANCSFSGSVLTCTTPTPLPSPTCANANCSFAGVVLTAITPTPLPSPTASATGCGLLSWSGLTINGDTTACVDIDPSPSPGQSGAPLCISHGKHVAPCAANFLAALKAVGMTHAYTGASPGPSPAPCASSQVVNDAIGANNLTGINSTGAWCYTQPIIKDGTSTAFTICSAAATESCGGGVADYFSVPSAALPVSTNITECSAVQDIVSPPITETLWSYDNADRIELYASGASTNHISVRSGGGQSDVSYADKAANWICVVSNGTNVITYINGVQSFTTTNNPSGGPGGNGGWGTQVVSGPTNECQCVVQWLAIGPAMTAAQMQWLYTQTGLP